ncbi:CrcB protein [Desulfohalotomaculum tongense]|uniref:fluoride efflux transporter CrcB n=1 Tax=Desulforadius tongensis TaxID=1216062 RepID=UPI00195677ED|nr:fluoride efflux transporter CrcB [Desulforadius tongensis]MBM7855001.1 CrcB protein [Desulforadius tongensis]
MRYLYVGMGGVLGAISRYLVSLMITPANSSTIPWQTLTVNFLGCYILGLIAFLNLWPINKNLRLALSTGFVGSLTTFSTFSVEVMYLVNQGCYIPALAYIIISLLGGIMLATLGMLTANAVNHRKKALEAE